MWGSNTASWSSLQNVIGAYTFSTVYYMSVPSHCFHHLRSPWWAPCWGLVSMLQGHSKHFSPCWVMCITQHGRHEWTMFIFMVSTWWATLEVKINYFSTFTFLHRDNIFIIGFIGFLSSRLCKALVSYCIFISMIWIHSTEQFWFCCCYWVVDSRNIMLPSDLEHYCLNIPISFCLQLGTPYWVSIFLVNPWDDHWLTKLALFSPELVPIW